MSIDPYSSCPCGSGKNFKWCCQTYYGTFEKALDLFDQGQQDAALATMERLVAQYPDRAPVWGYQAQLLFMAERFEEADESIQKAFALQPDFPLGHYLRGVIRQGEGEVIGALIEFRKAAELYDPKTAEILGQIHESIAELELRMNRPVAAHAALERAVRLQPSKQELRNLAGALFGHESTLPESARKLYSFRPAAPERQAAWTKAIGSPDRGRLTEAVKAFDQLTRQDPNDAAAWFNLAVARAWLGDNARAVEALDASIDLDPDLDRTAEAAALGEVLRCGHGMTELSDHRTHRTFFRLADPQGLVGLLKAWEQKHRLIGVRTDQETGSLTALLLEDTPQFSAEIGTPVARAQAHLFVVADQLHLWNPNADRVAKAAAEVKQRLGSTASEPTHHVIPPNFGDVVLEAFSFPNRPASPESVRERMAEIAAQYFEEEWLRRPLRSLAGLSPIDAAASPVYRKRLPGVIQFLEECFRGSAPRPGEGESAAGLQSLYDFDRLRRKLGLTEGAGPAPVGQARRDMNAMSTEELAGLSADNLSDDELGQAFRAAIKLDAQDLAGHFARKAVARPATAGADRYPFYNHLVDLAQSEGDAGAVLKWLDEAEAADRATNEGRRSGDYALRRGKVYARQGQAEKAREVFQGAIAAEPATLRAYGTAAEAMLGQKKGLWALDFAEQGLTRARSQNDRDSEQYFLELAAAAKKLGS